MNNVNYIFLEEYKKLEKICNEMYGTHNGVTCYIDDMKAVSHINYRNIPNWETDLSYLRKMRHFRNRLVHEAGSFDENICTQDNVEWVRFFHKRILNQSDPLALLHQNLARRMQTTVTVPKNMRKKYSSIDFKENSSPSTGSTIFTIFTIFIITFVIVMLVLLLH